METLARSFPGPDLPEHLSERVRHLNDAPIVEPGRFVLCWLHHAVRDHENPVIDVAVEIGNAIGRPVFVYQGLGGRHRFNSDRHHAFILEGARELEAGLAARGIAHAFRLPTDPAEPSPLRGLLQHACAFVTEDFPAPPFPAWTQRLAGRAPCAALAVDGACLMPLRLLGRRFTRAYAFRDAARGEWQRRIRRPWTDVAPAVGPPETDAHLLGFVPLDLGTADIAAQCARCDIDHGVPPVTQTPGGSAAGYARWDAFRSAHLARYDQRRNDAADMDAVSGLSPYLHHGHVSPFRIAREADEIGGGGAEKFLDELLVWRELAFNFCAHTPADHIETLAALPEWARRTLEQHESDERRSIFTWETLSRGATGDRLWDAAQRSLTLNGELHNNLRMTWGKMIPRWTRSPADALALLIDLNHRYALDGSDPCSYGGLLWCLGQFDRPFTPEQPVLGAVRGRSTATHAKRLDPSRFTAAVRARCGAAPLRVAVVGAGVSGLACARVLRNQACDVVVLDRGRVPGGRLSSRRRDGQDGAGTAFDHGAPYFTVADARFGRHVRSWIADGVCERWHARTAVWRDGALRATAPERPLIVGVPTMSAVARHLARDLEVRRESTVAGLSRGGEDGWRLIFEGGAAGAAGAGAEGPFDAVVVAAPAAQAARLVAPHVESMDGALAEVSALPAWIAMIGLDAALAGLPDVIEVVNHPAVDLVVRDDAKPGRDARGDRSRWVVHARPGWSAHRYDAQRTQAESELVREALRLLGAIAGTRIAAERVVFSAAHRWGLARPAAPLPERCLFDREARLAVCGDGLGGTGVEAAFLSGHAAAGRVLSLRVRAERPAPCRGDRPPSLFVEHPAR